MLFGIMSSAVMKLPANTGSDTRNDLNISDTIGGSLKFDTATGVKQQNQVLVKKKLNIC